MGKAPARSAPKAAAKADPAPAAEPATPKSDNRVAKLESDIEAMLETMRRNGWHTHR